MEKPVAEKGPAAISGPRNNEGGIENFADIDTARALVEVMVFLFLILPSAVLSFFVVKTGGMGFMLVAMATIVRDLGLVGLILYFIWHNGESISRIGWTLDDLRGNIILGIVLFIPFFFASGLLEGALLSMGFSAPSTPGPSFLEAKGMTESVMGVVVVTIVAISEETIFRGYLILRFKPIFASPIKAAALSAVIFSFGHGYEGSAGVLTVGTMGFVFALVYLWRKSLVAPVAMHFFQDLTSIVLVPLLHGK